MTMTTTTAPIDRTVDLILGEEPHLRRVARRLVRCESDSEDLVQETLLRAYRARDSFSPDTSVRAWTTTILQRVFLTGAISRKRRRLQTDTDAGGILDAAIGRTEVPHAEPSADLQAFGEVLDDVVRRALVHVPEVYRTSFVLATVLEMTCDEIGRQLGVPPRTVMSRVHRARQRLKCDLEPHRRMLGIPTCRAAARPWEQKRLASSRGMDARVSA